MNEISSLGGIWAETTPSETSSGIILIENMTKVFVLAEALCDKKEFSFLDISNNLKKHRETREFDLLLNGSLSYLGQLGDFYASEKSAGNGYTITELKHNSMDVYVHAVHTFDPTSIFRKEYLLMNSDEENPRYALFRYALSRDRTKLQHLEFSIPSKDGEITKSVNLMPLFSRCKAQMKLSGKEDAIATLQQIKAAMIDINKERLAKAEEK